MYPDQFFDAVTFSERISGDSAGQVLDAVATIQQVARVIAKLEFESTPYDLAELPVMQVQRALVSLAVASTAMYAAVEARCTLDQPPTELDTEPRGPDHKLITRCKHFPPHCWEGTTFVPCPSES